MTSDDFRALRASLNANGIGVAFGSAAARRAVRQDAERGLRRLLTHCAGGHIAPEAWVLARSPLGAPRVLGPEPRFGVSITYAGRCYAIAVAAHRRVGIDLEVDAVLPEEDRPLHLLSVAEAGLLGTAKTEFLTIWTLKEALAKEAGVGLLGDFRAFDAAVHARKCPFDLSTDRHGRLVCHARLRLDGELLHFALAAGPVRT